MGPALPPLSLMGLLFRERTVVDMVPNTIVSIVIKVYNGEEMETPAHVSCIKISKPAKLLQ